MDSRNEDLFFSFLVFVSNTRRYLWVRIPAENTFLFLVFISHFPNCFERNSGYLRLYCFSVSKIWFAKIMVMASLCFFFVKKKKVMQQQVLVTFSIFFQSFLSFEHLFPELRLELVYVYNFLFQLNMLMIMKYVGSQ